MLSLFCKWQNKNVIPFFPWYNSEWENGIWVQLYVQVLFSISMQQRPNVMRIVCPLLIITPELVLVPKQWTGLSTGAGLCKNQDMLLRLFLMCFPCLRYLYGSNAGNSLVIQWLKFHLLVGGIAHSIPDQRAKISYALWSKSQKHNREALW